MQRRSSVHDLQLESSFVSVPHIFVESICCSSSCIVGQDCMDYIRIACLSRIFCACLLQINSFNASLAKSVLELLYLAGFMKTVPAGSWRPHTLN